MKILWVSNAAWTNTGYGVATNAVTQQLVKHGHEPTVLAFWGLQGGRLDIDGVPHISPRRETWGNDYIADCYQKMSMDFVLTLRDIWVNDVDMTKAVPLAAWHPIDHAPVSDAITERMKHTRWNATMSRWAVEECRKAGFAADYIPHSINPAVFNYRRAPEFRPGLFGGAIPEDAFLMTIVGANKGFPSRKAFPEMFEAVAAIQREHPAAYLYVHALPTNEDGGPDLQRLAKKLGLDLKRVQIMNPWMHWQGVENLVLAQIYQASDVLLNCSYGEGFGIPILEAQACGTPVITTDFSSMPEITWNGVVIPATQRQYTPHYAWWALPKPDDIVQAIELIMGNRERWAAKSKYTADQIATDWTDEAIYKTCWVPWLEKIERDLVMDHRPASAAVRSVDLLARK